MTIENSTNKNLGMVDIGNKNITQRLAKAKATVKFSEEAINEFIDNGSPKGDVLETARVAGVLAAKATPSIVPLCHPILLTKINISFDVNKSNHTIDVLTEVSCDAKTGAEMEALTAASAAALTIYDMMKWKDKGIVISNIHLLKKTGGKSGDYECEY